jgi:hypothetical protein
MVLDRSHPRQYNSAMRSLSAFLAILLSIATLAAAQSGTKRYLYPACPMGPRRKAVPILPAF